MHIGDTALLADRDETVYIKTEMHHVDSNLILTETDRRGLLTKMLKLCEYI